MKLLRPFLILLGALLAMFATPVAAGATETSPAADAAVAPAAAPIGPCTPYLSTSFVAAVCTVRSGEYSASVTPSVLLPPNQVAAAVGGGVCEGGPWCVHFYAGTDQVVVCYGYPMGPGAYICV